MRNRCLVLLLTNCLALSAGSARSFGQSSAHNDESWQETSDEELDQEEASTRNARATAQAEQIKTASATTVRRFHEVLDELLAEFGYDVKMGQIKGLANLAIRKVRVSQAIPKTYEDYAEMLVAERIRENSRIKLITCVPCKTRTSSLVDGKLMITSPATNMAKLDAAAAMLGIENFMDVVLVYHTTHMVLAVNIFSAQTKELVWARTYNSETTRSRYQKLAIDYSQVAKPEPGNDYAPEYRILVGIGGASMPNVAGGAKDRSMLNLQIRASERFNNRRTEFGILLSVLKTTASLFDQYPTDTAQNTAADETPPLATAAASSKPTPKPFNQAIGVYATYGHMFVGAVESYNDVRHGANIGLGGLATSGYLAPAARIGWDIFMGRRFAVGIGANYVGTAAVLIDGEAVEAKGGAGGDFILSLNF